MKVSNIFRDKWAWWCRFCHWLVVFIQAAQLGKPCPGAQSLALKSDYLSEFFGVGMESVLLLTAQIGALGLSLSSFCSSKFSKRPVLFRKSFFWLECTHGDIFCPSFSFYGLGMGIFLRFWSKGTSDIRHTDIADTILNRLRGRFSDEY